MTADRHSINSTAAAFTVPVGLPHNDFMAPFSAPGTVASMTRPVYPPSVRVDSGGCLGRAVTPEFLFLRGESAARVGPPSASTGPTGPRARHSWRAGSVESPGITSGSQKTGFANRGFALGLGPAWLGPRWAADVAERTEDTGPRLTGRTGDHPGLKDAYPAGPANCSARTRSTGYLRGPVLPGRRGCPAQGWFIRWLIRAAAHESGIRVFNSKTVPEKEHSIDATTQPPRPYPHRL